MILNHFFAYQVPVISSIGGRKISFKSLFSIIISLNRPIKNRPIKSRAKNFATSKITSFIELPKNLLMMNSFFISQLDFAL